MENFGKTAVFPGGLGRIGVYRVNNNFILIAILCNNKLAFDYVM